MPPRTEPACPGVLVSGWRTATRIAVVTALWADNEVEVVLGLGQHPGTRHPEA